MDSVAIVVGLCVLAVVFALVIAANRAMHRQRLANLRRLADRLDAGRVSAQDGWFADLDGATVQGRLNGHEVRVRYRHEVVGHGKNRRTIRYLKAQVVVRDPLAHRFTIERAGMLKKVGRFLGLVRDVKTGDGRIDDKYILNGRPDALGQLFAEPAAEQGLDALLGRHGFPSVELVRGRLEAEQRSSSTDPRWLEAVLLRLVQVARLCDRKQVQIKVLGETIHFAWTGGGEDARCPYCRDGIDPDALELAACERCDTVHHAECLEEAGGCVVFGCGGGRTRKRAR